MRLPGGILDIRGSNTPVKYLFCAFALFYFVLILIVRHFSWRDPGSFFFDPEEAYTPQYSSVRLQQAEEYLGNASSESFGSHGRRKWKEPEICVGVVGIARVGVRYLRTAVASLVTDLTQEERDAIHLIVFIPHVDPTIHPAYHDQWLANLADELLVYNLTGAELERVKGLEEKKDARWKIMLDYQYLMKHCYATGAPYIALLEDDTLAMEGWYHRTMQGLKEAEKRTGIEEWKEDSKGFLYLRMFYTEEFHGWNIETAPGRAIWCIILIAAVGGFLIWLRTLSPHLRQYLTNLGILATCCICMPLMIMLYFSAGKVTTRPLPHGINEMNKYGCCAQGLVWPREKARQLMKWYDETNPYGYGDVLIEEYADRLGEVRYALTPSVIQHIGSKSSKADDFGPAAKHNRNVAQKLWNFEYELYDVAELKREHQQAIEEAWVP